MSRALLAVLVGLASGCATSPEPAPLPKDADHITTETLKELVAPPATAPAPVPYKALAIEAAQAKTEPALVVLADPKKPIVSLRPARRASPR